MTWPTTTSIPDISIGVTAGQARTLVAARALEPGTVVNIGFVDGESMEDRVGAAAGVTRAGFVAEPHVAARRLVSSGELDTYLEALRAVGAEDRLFVIGGDPRTPLGPYDQALQVIDSDVLGRFRPSTIGIGGYPDGHPDIEPVELDRALDRKVRALSARGVAGELITQVTLDAAGVLDWIERLRGRGVELPVRIGVPGPARTPAVLQFASQFTGAHGSAPIARYAGRAVTADDVVAGDGFVDLIRARFDQGRHGSLGLHVFALGDAAATARWVASQRTAGAAADVTVRP
jgi:methylenetetrahydrofolate reductase (NADPH)